MPTARRLAPRRRKVTILNQRGLHARAAAKFVKCVGQHRSEVTVTKDGQKVSGLSIMGLMTLAATKGTQIAIAARGPDADAALAALVALVQDLFGEGE
jgi:phosphocarrier protein HPr